MTKEALEKGMKLQKEIDSWKNELRFIDGFIKPDGIFYYGFAINIYETSYPPEIKIHMRDLIDKDVQIEFLKKVQKALKDKISVLEKQLELL